MDTLEKLSHVSFLGLGYIYAYLAMIFLIFIIYLYRFDIISKRREILSARLNSSCSQILLFELIAKDDNFEFIYESDRIKLSEIYFFKKTKARLNEVESFISDIITIDNEYFLQKNLGFDKSKMLELKISLEKQLEINNHPEVKLSSSQTIIITEVINIISTADDCGEKLFFNVYIKMLYLSVKLKHFNIYS